MDDVTKQNASVAEDILWGTQAIADFLGRSLHETQYLIRKRALPIGRLGPKLLFSSKQQLQRRLTPQIESRKNPVGS
jgi:hypothetical protein